jgi:uncharacterized membrane protein
LAGNCDLNENTAKNHRKKWLSGLTGSSAAFFVVSLLWSSWWAALEIIRYRHGFATVFDLGSTAQSLYLIGHGHWLAYNTFLNKPTLLDIDAFVLYLLAWPFRFLGGVVFLLILQASCLLVFGRAAYEYTWQKSSSRWVAWISGILALSAPALLGGLMFDFHVDFIALLGLSLALLASASQNRWLFFSGILLALLSKNVAAIPIGAWALVELIVPHDLPRRVWLAAGIMATVIFLFDEEVIPLLFGVSGPSHLAIFSQYGQSGKQIVETLILHPTLIAKAVLDHARYLAELAGPWGFLPLVSGVYLVPFMALVILNDLSNNPALRALSTQYSVIIVFFGLLAAAHSLPLLKNRGKLQLSMTGAVGVGMTLFLLKGLVATEIRPQISFNPPAQGEFELAREVNHTADAAIWTTNHLGAMVFSHPVVGTDAFESIAILWQQRQKLDPDAPIVLFMPRGDQNLDVNDTVWEALTHHYHVAAFNAVALILRGTETFPAYPQFAYASQSAESVYNPVFPEHFPAIMGLVDKGHVSKSGWVNAQQAGIVVQGVATALPSGTYTLTFRIRAAGALGTGSTVQLLSARTHRVLAKTRIVHTSALSLTWTQNHDQWVYPAVRWDGRGQLSYFGVVIRMIGGPS